MRKLLVVLSALAFSLFALTSYAAAAMNVGVVDLQDIFHNSPKVEAASQTLQKEFLPDQQKIQAEQQKLQKLSTQLKRDASIMKDKDKAALQNQIQAEQQKVMQMSQDYQQKAFAAQQKTMQDIISHIQNVVKKIAQSKGLTIVFDKAATVYADSSLDITQDVRDALK